MKKRRIITLFAVMTMTSLLFVGCGAKETVTDNNAATEIETNVAEDETLTQEENESEAVADTGIVAEETTDELASEQTEEPAPTPTEEPKSEPAEEPTPTPEPVHEHSYTETIIVEGTCTSWGTKRYTCSCGDSYEKEYALDHVSDGNRVMVVEPNCTTEGISAEHCIYCGERLYAELASGTTGHVPKNYWTYFPQSGEYYNYCSICNHVTAVTTTRPEGVEIREATPVDSNTLQPVP